MFDVTVYLPKSSGTSPLHVKNFETDMPLFAHYIGALAETVNFDLLSLKTANVPIHVEVSIYLTLLGSDLAKRFG
jgi:hypothetical protein